MNEMNEAITLMAVGMITVFFILFLIVFIGNLIIRFSNKYLPEEIIPVKLKKNTEASSNTFAAITAAIEVATKGKGKITNIKKI